MFLVVFFFKQKTAYEMRISDWSSDVCSSDLPSQIQNGRTSTSAPIMVAWNDKSPSRFPSLTISLLIRSQTPTRFSATPPRKFGLSQGWRFSDAERQYSLGFCARAGFRQHQIDRKSTRLNSSH